MTQLIFLVVVGTSIWVFFDAKSIGVKRGQIKGIADMNPFGWLLSCLLLWIVAFPIYLSKRNEFKRISQQPQAKDDHSSQNSISALEQIEKLAAMKEAGIITEAEFLAKKKSLLGL